MLPLRRKYLAKKDLWQIVVDQDDSRHGPCFPRCNKPTPSPAWKDAQMVANLVMLALAYGMIVGSLLWLARPVRTVNPY